MKSDPPHHPSILFYFPLLLEPLFDPNSPSFFISTQHPILKTPTNPTPPPQIVVHLPSLSSPQLCHYLDSCLAPSSALQEEEKQELAAIHNLIAPKGWREGFQSVKVEVEIPDTASNAEGSDLEEEEVEVKCVNEAAMIGKEHQDRKDATEASKLDVRKKKAKAPNTCRYDPTCDITFRSTKVLIEHERTKHGALYVPVTIEPYRLEKGRPVDCKECHMKIDNGQIFLEHLRKHVVENFKCECPNLPNTDICTEGSELSGEFLSKERHMRVEHQGWLACQERIAWQDTSKGAGEECSFIYQSTDDLEKHVKTNHREKKQKLPPKHPDRRTNEMNKRYGKEQMEKNVLCPDCGKEFVARGHSGQYLVEFEKHQLSHKVEAFQCPCPGVPRIITRLGQVYKINKEYKEKERHMKMEHMGWHGCTDCFECFLTMEEVDKHKEIHSMNYICDLCGFKAEGGKNAIEKLRWHKKVMHEAVMVPCQDCGKMIKDKYMRLHKRKVHTASACEICGVVLKNVKHHMQTVHMADSDKRFICKECGKGFMCKNTMESHRMNMHIKSQPHQCRYGCDNRYNDVSNRNAHERRRHGGVFS